MKIEKSLNEDNMNQRLLKIHYAVRGPILERALAIQTDLNEGVLKPFKRVIRANIGDCHALGQRPITFIRQVLALATCPGLRSLKNIPEDVKERVREILGECVSGSVGSYSPAPGLLLIRKHVAQYLTARDGVAANFNNIYLGSGASDLIKSVLTLFVEKVDGKPPGVMIPIPQYPLFSGTLSELGLQQVDYYLDEDEGWVLKYEELERSWRAASEHCSVRAIVVINPGNPTGQVLSRDNIEDIIRFAYKHNLFIVADEVYQENIISKPFHSFKKVMHEMGDPFKKLQLSSFMTCSKGWAAECGLRAGVLELVSLEPRVISALEAARSTQQCASVLGQCVVDCVMRPPTPGSPSFSLFSSERDRLRRALSERAFAAHTAFNSIPGYFCNPIEGAMFAFPRIEIPGKAKQEAAERSLVPDEFYCLRLLEETGVCVVPGSGFGQRPGSYHFRTTILHDKDEFSYMLACIRRFHLNFIEEYS
ncbi:alanine aminotransferase 1-like [Danaus plexippus]|uniref:alanine aminotransferase 1-like n=1 Tax=Danaus plexippus TaxID=13037 RepID=UPI002AB27F85|nr:alanine aminotransferase 1-like [Danaus plexippus]